MGTEENSVNGEYQDLPTSSVWGPMNLVEHLYARPMQYDPRMEELSRGYRETYFENEQNP